MEWRRSWHESGGIDVVGTFTDITVVTVDMGGTSAEATVTDVNFVLSRVFALSCCKRVSGVAKSVWELD